MINIRYVSYNCIKQKVMYRVWRRHGVFRSSSDDNVNMILSNFFAQFFRDDDENVRIVRITHDLFPFFLLLL